MPASFNILRLRPEHTGLVPGLLDMFGAAFEDIESYNAKRPDAAYLCKLVAKNGVIVLAAEREGRVIGGLVA